MNLLVDMGNTRLKWILVDPGWILVDPGWLLIDISRAEVQERNLRSGGALQRGVDLTRQLDEAWSKLVVPQRVVVASVAGAEAQHDLQTWVHHHWPAARLHYVVATAAQLGVKNSYYEPAHLGSDRWAALIGARQRVTGPVCVVDCGTAITLDALDAAGEFVGGVILPGIALARQALLARAAGIASTDGDGSTCFAHSTADGVAAGTLYGAAGAVERIVTEFGLRLGKDMRVLLTGGDAPHLRRHLHARLAYDMEEVPDLVLQGLARIAESLT